MTVVQSVFTTVRSGVYYSLPMDYGSILIVC